ncbi:hypothetical protein P0136_03100 [Lentisphaerota bacterium ZTH]|nr:hypothetical protein JYG24_05765 [Lentisphaerota bacterium]WET06989.1 hypothetical protein P0136_03100 [Lentisphaerota bacterium ZTH]
MLMETLFAVLNSKCLQAWNKKKFFIWILFLILLSTNPLISFGQAVQGKDIYDYSSISIFPKSDIIYAKQWSLLPTWFIDNPPDWSIFPLFLEIPAIGVCRKNGYAFRQRLLIINMNEHALELLPRHVRRSIMPKVSQFHNMGVIAALSDLTIHICAVITGKGCFPDHKTMVGKEFNLSFHGLASRYHPWTAKRIKQNLPVGIFVPLGIVSASHDSIPMGRIYSVLVTCERDKYCIFGPDTAKFKTSSAISSFWSVGKIGDRGEDIIVTYHLLLNTSTISDALQAVLDTDDFPKMLREIRAIPEQLGLDEFSSYVLYDWIDNIAHVSRPFE